MFGTTPSLPSSSINLPIHRPRKGHPETVLCLSPMETLEAHFISRSMVCPGEEICGLCQAGRPKRSISYFVAVVGSNLRLIRLSGPAAIGLLSTPPSYGRIFRIESVGTKKPLRISHEGDCDKQQWTEYSGLMLIKILAAIHGLGTLAEAETYDDALLLANQQAEILINLQALDHSS